MNGNSFFNPPSETQNPRSASFLRVSLFLLLVSNVAVLFSIAASQTLLGVSLGLFLLARERPALAPLWPPLLVYMGWTLVSLVTAAPMAYGLPQIRKFYIFAILLLGYTLFRHVRESELAVSTIGLDVFRVKRRVLVLSAMPSALAGGVFGLQAGYIDVDAALGVDKTLLPVIMALMGGSGRVAGPVGAGALLLARGTEPVPVLHGGGQERDVRSGTLDTAAIAGFAVAADWAARNQADHADRIGKLRDNLIDQVRAAVPDAILNGPEPGPDRLASNAHFSFPGCEGDALLMLLDAKNIACSTGSACTAGVAQPSHVLLAMGADRARAKSSLRFTLGHTSTQEDVDALGDVIAEVVERARRAGR